MGLSAWYSAYFNPLGFGRRLFMQAIDLTLWRQRQIPVLGHFTLGAGLLLADVSGGGPGVGAVGMCFTGGFALGMMVDDGVVAPVLESTFCSTPL